MAKQMLTKRMLPKRADFTLRDVELSKTHLEFQIIDMSQLDEDPDIVSIKPLKSAGNQQVEALISANIENTERDYDERYKIELFGVDKQGKSIQLDVIGFTPFFYIQLPSYFTKPVVEAFLTKIEQMVKAPYRGNCFIKAMCKVFEREKFYGFTNHSKYKFLRLVFDNHNAMKACSYIFSRPLNFGGITRGSHKFELYESNIDPILRFIHLRDIQPTGWVSISYLDLQHLPSGHSGCQSHYKTHYKYVSPKKDADEIGPYVCMAFDIECVSETGGFPKPERKGDQVIMITSTFRRYGETKSFAKITIHLKESEEVGNGNLLIHCKTERELLMTWRDIVVALDPEFIYGYNSSGFDFTYMVKRAELLGCSLEFLKMSRVPWRSGEYVEKKLSSSALGDNLLKYIEMTGRVILDVMKEVQKEPAKLDMYKLDFVLKHYLGDSKVDLSPQELFAKYREGSKDAIRDIAIYCIQDTDSCHNIVWHLNLIVKAMKMANVCLVPLYFIFSRGQGIKIFSLISNECRKRGILMPVVKKKYNFVNDEEREEAKLAEKYEGAYVIDPKVGTYYDPIVVLDYNSLYPNCERGWNISHDTLVMDSRFNNLPDLQYEEIRYKEADGSETICRYVQPTEDGNNVGIIPAVCAWLLKARKDVKKQMKTEKNPEKLMLLDVQQLAYKLVCNSVYGQTGASTSPIYLKAIGASTTAKGREMLELAQRVGNSFPNVECIYGDTDSNFYKITGLKGTQEEILTQAKEIGEAISLAVNKAIGKEGIMNFAYEKIFLPFLISTKKRYYGRKYEEDMTKYKDSVMGLALKRRDFCKFTKEMLQGVFDMIMESTTPNPNKIANFVRDKLDRLIKGEVPLEDLVITNTLKEGYKNEDSQGHVVLAKRMRERGETVNFNDRIPYIFSMIEPKYNTRGNPVKRLQSEFLEEFNYAKRHGVKYDPEIYIESQLRKTITQITDFVMENSQELFDEAIGKCREMKYQIYGHPSVLAPKRKTAKKT